VGKLLGAVAALLLVGTVVFAQGNDRPAPAPPMFLGPGVTFTMGSLKNPPHGSNIVSLEVTVTNRGTDAINLKYCDFSLADGAGQRSMALLPAELADKRVARLLGEGVLPSGQSRSGTLYFRTPFAFARPFDLRVDLETASNANVSRTFWPL
jgi:hypothetical protein